MRLFSKYNGVPNSHLFIAIVYSILVVITTLSMFVSGVQDFLNSSLIRLHVYFINPYFWIYVLGVGICFGLVIIVTDFIFIYLGYWSKYQMPLHKVVRAFYKKNDSSRAIDATGKPYMLSDAELADRNKAVRNAYLKSNKSGLLLIIPCSHWGFIGTASSVIDKLRDNRGSLDLAQRVVSSNFRNYRFQIRHYSFQGHLIVWSLIHK